MNAIKYDIILYDITVKNDKMIINLYCNILIYETWSNILYVTYNNIKYVRLCLVT